MSEGPTARVAADVRLERVEKSFDGKTRVVDRIDLTVEPGEFFALLGPSGCGKTTTLRMIAGFEEPDDGRITVGGEDVTHMPVHRRDMGMIFQSYALFPHRTVAENVAFGLRMRGLGKDEISERVDQALRQVALEGYEDRRPAQLSGGQQQRVALARAIVIRPRVLLCDEPLAALDRKLRQSMQFELKQLQQQLGVTLIFVTHDQEEAMTVSDRIAVMNAGRIDQIGVAERDLQSPAHALRLGLHRRDQSVRGRVARRRIRLERQGAAGAGAARSGARHHRDPPRAPAADRRRGALSGHDQDQHLRVRPDDLSGRDRGWPGADREGSRHRRRRARPARRSASTGIRAMS